MRLTVTIDRKEMSRTITSLFRLGAESTPTVPEQAWIGMAYG